MHSYSTFGARTRHRQTWTHKTHHGLYLGETTTFPLIVLSMPSHRTSTQMSFCLGTPTFPSGSPEISKIGTPATLQAHNFMCKPPIDVRSKATLYSSSRAFQRYVVCYLQTKKSGNSWLLVVESQIDNLTLDLSFGHNLCFKYPNGSFEPILDM